MRSLSGPPQGSGEPVRKSEPGVPAKGLGKTRLVGAGGAPVPKGVGPAPDGYGRRREGERTDGMDPSLARTERSYEEVQARLFCSKCARDSERKEWARIWRALASGTRGSPMATVFRHRPCGSLAYVTWL
jgi:hypothetical protein